MTSKLRFAEWTGMPVGKIVAQRPATARVFERYQIDYCCKGNQSLESACRDKHLETAQIAQELDDALSCQNAPQENWVERGLGELCDHIEQTHHAFLKLELPRLSGLIEKVAQAHGDRHPELLQLKGAFRMLRAELEPHLQKEEQILFPAIRTLEQASKRVCFPFGSVENPIRCMEHEHDGTGEALSQLRSLTHDFQVPPDACPTYRVMLDSLAKLELDLHAHIHKENQILFLRAQQLEKSKQQS